MVVGEGMVIRRRIRHTRSRNTMVIEAVECREGEEALRDIWMMGGEGDMIREEGNRVEAHHHDRGLRWMMGEDLIQEGEVGLNRDLPWILGEVQVIKVDIQMEDVVVDLDL